MPNQKESGSPAKDSQTNKWQLTINNPDEKGYTPDSIFEKCKSSFQTLQYLCLAREKGTTEHYHIFIYTSSKTRFSMIKRAFPDAHIEKCRGTVSQNVEYIRKGSKWENTDKAETRIAGTFHQGYCFVVAVMQRFSAQLFPTGIGAKDNFSICVGLGNLSVESRTALFAGEHFGDEAFEKSFRGGKGKGLCLIEGRPLKALGVPYISDKEKLKRLLRKMAGQRRGR